MAGFCNLLPGNVTTCEVDAVLEALHKVVDSRLTLGGTVYRKDIFLSVDIPEEDLLWDLNEMD